MEEYNIEVDENNRRIGLRPRSDFYTGDYIHRATHLILFNSRGDILLQHRAPTKQWYPDLLTYSVSGTVADESCDTCIAREIQEEIGITVTPRHIFTYPFFAPTKKAWHYVYVGHSDDPIIPDKTEMSGVVWIAPDQLRADIQKNPHKYTPPFVEGMTRYFTTHAKKENVSSS